MTSGFRLVIDVNDDALSTRLYDFIMDTSEELEDGNNSYYKATAFDPDDVSADYEMLVDYIKSFGSTPEETIILVSW